jgi:hypothetical protein
VNTGYSRNAGYPREADYYRPRRESDRDAPIPAGALLHASDLLLPIGIALWALGVSRTNAQVLGPYGLPVLLPIIFYAGIVVVLASAIVELARRDISTWRMALHAVALVVMLYGTAPLIYPDARYSWLYKTVGVVQYVNAGGSLNPTIDIYQNWPGFFALAEWFDKVAGVASPLVYAKWAQLLFELAILPLLYLIYSALSLTDRQRWVAILLFSASNWIGQDYLSPQALGVILSLGVMALAVRWLYNERARDQAAARNRGARRGRRRYVPRFLALGLPDPPEPLATSRSADWPIAVMLCLLFFVLTFTHELSPYMLIVELGALAIFRLLRPRWLPIVLAVIAIGYLAPRFGWVNSHLGLLKTIGSFITNLKPPSLSGLGAGPGQHLVQLSAQVLSLGIWLLAIVGAFVRRRYGQPVLGRAFLAFTPIMLVAVGAYGHEGILRAYLFSLPWSASLAAFALAPPARMRVRRPEDVYATPQKAQSNGPLRPARIALALVVALALFFPAFFGDDLSNVMTPKEVSTVSTFLNSNQCPSSVIYVPIEHAPLGDTADYNVWPIRWLFGQGGDFYYNPAKPPLHKPARPTATNLAKIALIRVGALRPAYFMVTPSMRAYSVTYKVATAADYDLLLNSVGHSSKTWQTVNVPHRTKKGLTIQSYKYKWRLIATDKQGTRIYQIDVKNQTTAVCAI